MPTINVNLPDGLVIFKGYFNMDDGDLPSDTDIRLGWEYEVELTDKETPVDIGTGDDAMQLWHGSLIRARQNNPGNTPANWKKTL